MSDRNRVFRAFGLGISGILLGITIPLIGAAVPTQPPGDAPASVWALLPTAPVASAESPTEVSGDLADTANVLDDADVARISDQLQQLKLDDGLLFSIYYINSFDQVQGEEWARQVWLNSGSASNRGVLAIAVQDRNLGVWVGDEFPEDPDTIGAAAREALFTDNWAGAAESAIAAVSDNGGPLIGDGSGNSSTNGVSGGAVLGIGLAGAVVIGGGAFIYSRRQQKKRTAAEIERGRAINPADIDELDSLSTKALDTLARDEIVSTDESIRKGATELDLARSEFGAERIRSFDSALRHSHNTLQRAFALRQQLDDGTVTDDIQRRGMLLEIISTCGVADDQLEAQAENFQKLRRELMQADSTIATLTQRSIAIRTRIPQVSAILEELRARYNEQMLSSISDNIDIATEHLGQSEQMIAQARRVAAQPAGQQAGLIDAISAADFALTQADRLLGSIEHAEANISAATAGLEALIAEVRGEITEGENLLVAPQGAKIDRQRLSEAMASGREALRIATDKASTDPLGAWTRLTDADELLDDALDSARDKAASFARAMATLQHSLQDAENHLRAASDLIDTRRAAVGAKARTRLSEAQRAYAMAQQLSGDDPRRAIRHAHRARKLAAEAARIAREDIQRYDNHRNNSGGSNNGAMIAGMVIGSLLSNNGGFGGSSGSSFGGGSFGGGGGGGRGSTMGF